MIIDDKFIARFQDQIDVLTNLKKAVDGAIERANINLAKLKERENHGKDTKELFGAASYKRSPDEYRLRRE